MGTLKLRKMLLKKLIHYVTSSPTGYRDLLRAERSEDRIPVTRFFAHVQTVPGPTKPPVQWAAGLFPVGERPERGANHQPSSSAGVKGRVELYLYCTCGTSWPVLSVSFTFT